MDVIDKIGEVARLASLVLIPLFFVLDTYLTNVIRRKCPEINSEYFQWQKRIGFGKALLVKIVLAAFVFYYATRTSPSGWHVKSSGAILYFAVMLWYFLDYMKHTTKRSEPKLKPSAGTKQSED